MKGYLNLRKQALGILKSELPTDLYYHDVHHTLDVLSVINQYIRRKKLDTTSKYLLKIAGLLHDIGYTVGRFNHEKKSAEIADKLMQDHGFSKTYIKIVKDLIKATKIPQTPKNELEKILCDSDLDYLGRKDFYYISNKLYRELLASSIVSNENEWNKLQIEFLKGHKYHTDFAIKNRQPSKEKRLLELQNLVKED
jgi:uncharacterized protein